ncbi:ORC ubiquitin ligase 1 [Pelobates fuscus]|uniref:ORC ubiquitin ligase 1 n=1 Tax=Pelobates fuscus TaxID=191477 RepID=UPI002FE464A2
MAVCGVLAISAGLRVRSTMAQNVQNVTLALTLPITCHICLGKVRQPVICANHHVFCSVCIDLWLKNNNQCPACRVPITSENPCKDIIGGAGENESVLSHSVRKHLRKTRLELLHKEYEDEIETLLKEIEDLKRTNDDLEKKLIEQVSPTTPPLPSECEISETEDKNGIRARKLEDILKKLQAASDSITKFTGDIETLKEENKKLRIENIEFGRENLRLKSEVVGRSPQKFGRFTVAALQAKVDQYEREMNRLKKALERSDQYIEDLEGQVEKLQQPSGVNQKGRSNCESNEQTEENGNQEVVGTAHDWRDINLEEFCKESDPSEFGDTLPSSSSCASSANQINVFADNTWSINLQTRICSKVNENLADDGIWKRSHEKDKLDEDKSETCTPSKGREVSEYCSPSNSLLPFSALQLNTPNSKDAPTVQQKSIKKPLTYLRKLFFDDLKKKSEAPFLVPGTIKSEKSPTNFMESDSLFLSCQNNGETQKEHLQHAQHQLVEPIQNHPVQQSLISECQVTSEDSIDAAYFNKVNELDSMISESENHRSPFLENQSSQATSSSTNATTLPNEHKQNGDKAFGESLILQSMHSPGNKPQTSEAFSIFSSQSPWHMSTSVTNFECKDSEFLNNIGFQTDHGIQNTVSLIPLTLSKDQVSVTSPQNKILSGDEGMDYTYSCVPSKKNSSSPAAKRKLLSWSTKDQLKVLK